MSSHTALPSDHLTHSVCVDEQCWTFRARGQHLGRTGELCSYAPESITKVIHSLAGQGAELVLNILWIEGDGGDVPGSWIITEVVCEVFE